MQNKYSTFQEMIFDQPNKTLQSLVEIISEECFNKSFNHTVYFNNRLRSTGGRYHVKCHDIDINPKMYTEHGLNTLIGIIKHELCHYHLNVNGYSGNHNTVEFQSLLKKVDGPRYAPAPAKIHYYVCTGCGNSFQESRKFNTNRYVCAKCHGRLRYVMKQSFKNDDGTSSDHENEILKKIIDHENLKKEVNKYA